MLAAAVAGWPAPLAAIQILWLNLVTDGLPALALGLEPPERDLMHRRPRPPHEPVITWGRGLEILLHGVIVATVMLVAFRVTWQGDDASLAAARTLTFCVAAFSQLLFAIACRSRAQTAVALGFLRNPSLLAAIVISALLQVTIVMLPQTQPVFAPGQMPLRWWLLAGGLSLVPAMLVELVKPLAVMVSGATAGTPRDRPVRPGS